jgi:hypothetical protein
LWITKPKTPTALGWRGSFLANLRQFYFFRPATGKQIEENYQDTNGDDRFVNRDIQIHNFKQTYPFDGDGTIYGFYIVD